MICKKCDKEFSTEKGLHLHIAKSHGTSLQEYYNNHFPRFDLQTGEPIQFSDTEDYFGRDFNTKENFAKWCLSEKPEVVQQYVLEAFKRRVQKKNSKYIPSHLELKTLFLPSFIGLDKIFGSVKNFIDKLDSFGLETKFNYSSKLSFLNVEPKILIDTREQNPLKFEGSKIVKLSCGDYTAVAPLYADVFIERKSLPDLVSTLSSGIERFKREINRAKALNYYIIVLVEDKFSNAMSWSPKTSFSKFVNGKYVFYRIREICNEFENVQFVFADNRQYAGQMMKKIFQLNEQVKTLDLEYLKDFKLI